VSKKFPQLTFIDKATYVKQNGDLMDICLVKGDTKDIKEVTRFLRKHKLVINAIFSEK
jgi:hypothetical protein